MVTYSSRCPPGLVICCLSHFRLHLGVVHDSYSSYHQLDPKVINWPHLPFWTFRTPALMSYRDRLLTCSFKESKFKFMVAVASCQKTVKKHAAWLSCSEISCGLLAQCDAQFRTFKPRLRGLPSQESPVIRGAYGAKCSDSYVLRSSIVANKCARKELETAFPVSACWRDP